jgi:uncharacterized membrane protein YfhO
MTTDSRIMPPNFSIMYKLQSVSGYDPLFLRNYAQLISASERGIPNIDEPFGFNRIITPHSYDSKIIDLLGVKYVLSMSDIKNKKLKKVFEEGKTEVYENKNAVPRAFFVSDVEYFSSKQNAVRQMFDSNFDAQKSAIVIGLPANKKVEKGFASIINYSEDKIIIKTENDNTGFLVLTDVYYPTWKAKIDGKNTQILEADLALRGIFVPKGNHTIEFSDHLF